MPEPTHPYASFWLDVIDKVAKVSGVFVAAIWAYWNHRRGRTFSSRLNATIEVELLDLEQGLWIVDVSIKNIGNALITLGEIRACRIVYLDSDLLEQSVAAYRVFDTEESLEPGESLHEQLLFKRILSPTTAILKAQFIVDGSGKSDDRWKADKVCFIRRDAANGTAHQDHRQSTSEAGRDGTDQERNRANSPKGSRRKGVKGALEK